MPASACVVADVSGICPDPELHHAQLDIYSNKLSTKVQQQRLCIPGSICTGSCFCLVEQLLVLELAVLPELHLVPRTPR